MVGADSCIARECTESYDAHEREIPVFISYYSIRHLGKEGTLTIY